MVGQRGVDLAVSIVSSHFGDLVAKVCDCLLRRGTLSLSEIIRFTELPNSQVKNCLLVLIQHNCVQAFSIPRSATGSAAAKTVTQYTVLFDNILHRLRFAKFMVIVKENLGPRCEALLEGLLQNGRLTFDQLVSRATSKRPDAGPNIRDCLRADFDRLVNGRYVERCPRAEPFLATSPDEETRPGRRRSAKSSEETYSVEQQALMAATLPDAERFSEITFTLKENLDVKPADEYSSVSSGDKRKYESLEIEEDVQAAITENEILWRTNFEKFVYCLKKKACVANVSSKLGIDAGVVLEAMIESTAQEKDKNLVKVSMDTILDGVRGKPGGISMTVEHIREVLRQLRCQPHTEGSHTSYVIDLKEIIETCQDEEVESLILTRYGKEAYRIFRLLIRNPVETDQITEKTLVEKKVAQDILYKLWKDEYIDMKKAVSHAAGQMQLFLWKVNKNSLWQHVLEDVHHAALNLNQKIAHFIEQDNEVTQPGAKRDQLKKSRWILEMSLYKLDDALMLFHDFR